MTTKRRTVTVALRADVRDRIKKVAGAIDLMIDSRDVSKEERSHLWALRNEVLAAQRDVDWLLSHKEPYSAMPDPNIAALVEDRPDTCDSCRREVSVGALERSRWTCYSCGRINSRGKQIG